MRIFEVYRRVWCVMTEIDTINIARAVDNATRFEIFRAFTFLFSTDYFQ